MAEEEGGGGFLEDETLPVANITIVKRGGGATFDVSPSSINITSELDNRLSGIELAGYRGTIDNTLFVGDTVRLWLTRMGGTSRKIFDGEIFLKEYDESGEPSKVMYKAVQVPQMSYFTTSVPSTQSIQMRSLILAIVKPLTDANYITTNEVNTMTWNVVYEGANTLEVLTALQKACQDNTLHWWLDYSIPANLHCLPVSSLTLSPLSLDQTSSLCEPIITSLYVQDISQVANTVTIVGTNDRVEPNGNKDSFTDDATGLGKWVAYIERTPGSGWVPANEELVGSLGFGTKGIALGYRDVSQNNIERVLATCDFGTTTIDALMGGNLKFKCLIDSFEEGWSYWNQHDNVQWLLVKLIDAGNKTIFTNFPIRNHSETEVKIPVGSLAAVKGVLTAPYDLWNGFVSSPSWGSEAYNWGVTATFDWSKITDFAVGFANRWRHYNYVNYTWTYEGDGMTGSTMIIDGLHFGDLPCRATTWDTASIGSFGVREYRYTKQESKKGLDSNEKCMKKAYSIIQRFKDPEVSMRGVTVYGDERWQIGDKIRVKTDLIDSTFKITSVVHEIDGLDWRSNLTLSSSPIKEPTMSREDLEIQTFLKLKDLETRLSALEGSISWVYVPAVGAVAQPIVTETINFNSIPFDWTSVVTGDTSWKAEFIDWFPVGFFTADAYGRQLFQNGFVNASLILDGAVTDSKINIPKHFFTGSFSNGPGTSINWTQSTLSFKGAAYTITPGTTGTANPFVWWDSPASSFSVSSSLPILAADDALVAYNSNGTANVLLTDKAFPGQCLFVESVMSDQIAANAITAAKIKAGEVTTQKLNVSAAYIDGLTWNKSASGLTISWTQHTITHLGTAYTVSAGTTSTSYYIWWDKSTPSSLKVETMKPPVIASDGDLLMCIVAPGTFWQCYNATAIYGAQIITQSIGAYEIAANAISASLLDIRTHLYEGGSFYWSGVGTSISWSAGTLYWKRPGFVMENQAISAGGTTLSYIYWLYKESSFRTANVFPSLDLEAGDMYIAFNDAGTPYLAIQPSIIHGGFIKTFSIDADRIQSHIITTDKLKVAAWELNNTFNAIFFDNSPSAGSIRWVAHSITYWDQEYAISAGTTSTVNNYVYWEFGESSYRTASSIPLPFHAKDCIIATNIGGTAVAAINATYINGANIRTASIFAEQIAANEIQTTHLSSSLITSDKIAANAIQAAHISANQINTDKLSLSRVTVDPTVVGGEIWYRYDTKKLMFARSATTICEIPTIKVGGVASAVINLVDNIIPIAWAGFFNWITGGLTAINSLGIISDAALSGIAMIADGLFTGASGLAKFVSGFWTADATGRGKFANSIWTNTYINDLSASKLTAGTINATSIIVQNINAGSINTGIMNANLITTGTLNATLAKVINMNASYINAGTLDAGVAKIANIDASSINTGTLNGFFVDCAYLNASSITSGTINTTLIMAGSILGAHLADGCVTIDKTAPGFGQESYMDAKHFVISGEDIIGYKTFIGGSSSIGIQKGKLELRPNGSPGTVALMGYPVLETTMSPSFKAKLKFYGQWNSIYWISAGIGNEHYITDYNEDIYAVGFGGREGGVAEAFIYSSNKDTLCTQTTYSCYMKSYGSALTISTGTGSGPYSLGAKFYKVSTGGVETLLTGATPVAPSTVGSVQERTAEYVFSQTDIGSDYGLKIYIMSYINSAWSTLCSFLMPYPLAGYYRGGNFSDDLYNKYRHWGGIIPSSTWTMHYFCFLDTNIIRFYVNGYSYAQVNSISILRGYAKQGPTANHTFAVRSLGAWGPSQVIQAKYDNTAKACTFTSNQVTTSFSYTFPTQILLDSQVILWSQGPASLAIFNFSSHEDWEE